jgi:arylsulfatase A-like enzyme
VWLQSCLDDGRVVEEAEAALDRWEGERRQFLYLHLMDPHPPLDPSPAGREAVGAPADWAPGGKMGHLWVKELRKRGTPEQKERVRDGYLATVWDADRSVGSILRAIEESGHGGDTVVVFFADHGEQIWEHGDHGHARGVWEELAHVPLLIRIPGRPPQRVDHAVGLLDLAPTLLKVLGIEEFPSSWQGRNLFEPDGRIVVSQRLRRTAITAEGRVKGILGSWPGGVGWRYFDLEGDPGEQKALANVEGAGKLRKDYELWSAGVPQVARDRRERPVGICVMKSERRDRLEEEALRAVGYIQ